MLTQKVIERLSKMGSKEHFISSLYLNINKNEKNHDYRIAMKTLLKEKRHRLDIVKHEKRLSREQVQSIESDFTKMEGFVTHEFIHKDASKGLVVFSSSILNYWETMELPQPVKDYLNVDYDPFIRPLSDLMCDHRSYAIALVDSSKAKLFDVTLGFVNEHLSWTDDVSSKTKFGGFEGTQERHADNAHGELMNKHFKKIATETEKLIDTKDIPWLVIGGRQNMITSFEAALSVSVRKKVVGHVVVEPDAPLAEVIRRTEDAARKAEDKHQADVIDRLRNEAQGNNGKGVHGLQPTLQSLRRGGVNTLVVTKGFTAPGFVCHKCFFIGTPDEKGSGASCPICGGPAHELEDVVEEAITYAYMQGCRVENTNENSRMKIMGNIGALLRY